MRNLKLAFRTLFKTPFVTAVAILSLALGIGANAAIFSLFDQMLLRPLPVREPERLVNLARAGPEAGLAVVQPGGRLRRRCSATRCSATSRRRQTVVHAASRRTRSSAPTSPTSGQTLNGEGMLVSGSYFPVLGLQPALGRLLAPDDDQTDRRALRRRAQPRATGRRSSAPTPAVVGQPIIVNGQPMTIVGVAPRGFEGTTLGDRPRVFVPITMRALDVARLRRASTNRRSYWVYLFARLKPGVTHRAGGGRA